MTTTSLTDRYVATAVRSVPEAQRAEFARELRERIGDATDALRATGHTEADAERTALTELGDPAAQAATYADRPLHLIGPRYFLTWLRLLKVLLLAGVAFVGGAVLLAELLADVAVPAAIATALSTAFSTGMGIAFWLTLVFALVDRYSPTTQPHAWTPDDLPDVPGGTGPGRLGDLIASAVFLALFASAIVWQQYNSTFDDAAGNPIPFLTPALWSFWIPWFLGVAVAELLFALAVYRRGWTWLLAAVNVLLNAAFAVPAVWLLQSGQLVNDAYLEAADWPWGGAGDVLLTLVTSALVVIALWDSADGVIKAARAARPPQE